ncbi:uncharacterized protein LOC105425902 [Pogonomyrmex barbatus]|uniref:Uncharacterized protein LOC105425902 n=1 Tax=Pogonomyrmex barbatus TaxID=144034 RepID=A0A6I9W524_9HYME|nr:uncharacterized protein LOC105425902 [Pogonomyrmex barbatus]XP_011635200.1 uncharacterized protein LOC105425902 [Pogonomyrmex barbatus]
MAKRRSLNRMSQRYSRRRSSSSMHSGLLNPDTEILDEERTFWWNHLQDSAQPSYSSILGNETSKYLNADSRVDSGQSRSEWWKNLESSDNEQNVSINIQRNSSAAIVKVNVLQSSTSESEKEVDLKKTKVYLKAGNRTSTAGSSVFLNALDDAEIASPSTSRMKLTSRSNLHDDSNREVSQRRLQEDDEDSSLIGKVLKSKSNIFDKKRKKNTGDHNIFQEMLIEDDDLNSNRKKKSVALEKKSSERLRNQDIDTERVSQTISSKNETGSFKLAFSNVTSEDNANKSSSDSDRKMKPKSRFIQRMRKSVGTNAFADILNDKNSISSSNQNKENDIRESITPQSLLSPSERSVNRSKNDITHAELSNLQNLRSSNATKKQLNVPGQTEDDMEINSSESSLDKNESHGKRSFLKPKSRILKKLRKSLAKNPFEEIFQENDVIRKDNISTADNRVSLEHGESQLQTRISQINELATEKRSQSKSRIMNEDDISLTGSSKKSDVSENRSKLPESNIVNESESISRKSTAAKTPEKQFFVSPKSTRKERTRTNVTSSVGRNIEEVIESEIISDDSNDNIDVELNSNVSKRSSKSFPNKEVRFTRNSSRNRSDTPKFANMKEPEISNNLHNDIDVENDSNTSEELSLNKKTRLTRKSLKDRAETPKPMNKEVHGISDYSHNNQSNKESDVNTSKRLSKSSPDKEARLTRYSLRDRSETPKSTNKKAHEVSDYLRDNTNEEPALSVSKRLSSPSKETRLSRRSLRNRSETPKLVNREEHEVFIHTHDNANIEQNLSMSKRSSKSSLNKEAPLTRISLRNQSQEISKSTTNLELSKRSINRIADTEKEEEEEEDDNINLNLEIDTGNISKLISSTRISAAKSSVSIRTQKNTISSVGMKIIDDEDSDRAMQTVERNSSLTKGETSNKTANRQSLNRISMKENRETTKRKSSNKSQNYHVTSIKSSSKNVPSNIDKIDSSKGLRKIDDFFKIRQSTTNEQSADRGQNIQVFDEEKIEKLKTELERIKNREMAAMKIDLANNKKKSELTGQVKSTMFKQTTKKKLPANSTKVVDKAFLVNGKVYKAPKLSRPKYWATDRLYKFLWNCMEPKYKLATRLKSEKFVQELVKVVSFVQRHKKYGNYKVAVKALMKEMARLNIINTCNDFYHFCQDFLPYEFRVKVVPMLLPGNTMNIPYNAESLHIPLLDTERLRP